MSDMTTNKPWYTSKGVWAGIITALLGAYDMAAGPCNLPPIPGGVYIALGSLGLYSRSTATQKIG